MANETKKTIQLKYPVKADGATIEQLAMRRPLVKDLHAAQRAGGGAAEVEVALFANLCEVAPEALGEMDLGDYRRLQGPTTVFCPTARPPRRPSHRSARLPPTTARDRRHGHAEPGRAPRGRPGHTSDRAVRLTE